MEAGVFAAGSRISLASFCIESLSSTSREMQLAGVCVLDGLLRQRDSTHSSEELVLRITSSSKVVRTLVGMLGWTVEQEREIRLFAARVIAELTGSLRIDSIPGMLKLVSSLLDAEDRPAWHRHQQDLPSHAVGININGENNVEDDQSPGQESSAQPGPGNGGSAGSQPNQGEDKNRGCSRVCRYWQRMKEKHWSIPKDPPLTHQDSLPVLGMLILEKLACDTDNCAEISRARDLIFKITGLMSYTTDREGDDDAQRKAVICSSLNLVRRFAVTGGEIGKTLRQELWESPFLLSNIAGVFEGSRSCPRLWKPAIDIIALFAFDEDARQEIGSTKVIIGKLMHVFLGRDGTANVCYDQQLRTAAGEALANLAIGSSANCSAILKEPGYELVDDLKSMISDDEYRYVATSLLQNLCAHSRDDLRHPGAREHLYSALPMVMEKIMAAEGKELEALIGLASQICYVIPECFVRELERHPNGAGLVRKLVDTVNSNKKPSLEYPRMRRVIVQLTISFVESCPRYATIFVAEGMMEALSKIERTPSKVEKYRAFFHNTGVVLESGLPLPVLVATAKSLIDSVTPIPSAQPSDHA